MEIELQEISEFIAAIPPFDDLPQAIIFKLTKSIKIRYLRRGTELKYNEQTQDRLFLLRKGAFSLSSNNKLLTKLGEGDFCTTFCLIAEQEHSADKMQVKVDEDSLVYLFQYQNLQQILNSYPQALSYFQHSASQRLNQTINEMQLKNEQSSSLLHSSIAEILHKTVISVESGLSIKNACILMAEKDISSLIILKDQQVIGILTDKDISRRCVAKAVPADHPVDEIMTKDIVSVRSDTDVFDAMMIMTRQKIRHLPVIDQQQLTGIVSVTDFLRVEGRNSFYLTHAINKADSIQALVEHSKGLAQLQLQSVQMGASADHVGKIITAISSAITRRLLQLAEKKLGPAPVPYAWVAAGSHARREQSSHSDQDNALIISDQLQAKDEPWFENLANFVCDGLALCGYIYCPGDVMASNPKWRQTQAKWHQYFQNWIKTPSPKALMYSSIFFDLRTIYGEQQFLHDIRQQMLQLTQKNELFLAHLSFNALKFKPPLGFFRDFVLVHDGKHNDTLDLKHNGLTPIIDLARIYALAEGIDAVNTIERLQQVSGSKSLSQEGAENLLDAYQFISSLRIKHQSQQIRAAIDADNYMAPSEISKLERTHLKDAFKVIQSMQSYLEMRYKIS